MCVALLVGSPGACVGGCRGVMGAVFIFHGLIQLHLCGRHLGMLLENRDESPEISSDTSPGEDHSTSNIYVAVTF